MSGKEPCLMARWKSLVEFLLSVIELLFLSLTVEALQGKTCHNSLLSGEGGSLGAKISGEYFGFYKLDTFLVSDSANCNVLRAVVLTQYRRVTDGIAVASTGLAMRRAVKIHQFQSSNKKAELKRK